MAFDKEKLQVLREKFGGDNESVIYDEHFRAVAATVIDEHGTRDAPWAGIPTFLDTPYRQMDWDTPDLTELDVALLGVPMDLGVSNRNGAKFGPRALRIIERIGPYNHVLKSLPTKSMRVEDVGDVPFRSRFDLATCHDDIERTIASIIAAGVIPVSIGGDHSVTLPILRAIARNGPVGLVHVDAHCDTGGPFDGCKFHHGGPFRHTVLEGLVDPERTVQIGIRGSAEYHWEFSYASGMTVIHAEDIDRLGVDGVIAKAREVVGDLPVYVTYDIDSLDPAFAPGTGTPEVGGMTVREAQSILRGLAGINIVGGDVVEVAPQYDATTNTAHAGAQILFEILSLVHAKAQG
ncbi:MULTISPECIES: agmatinase [unclassified Burkholderia]|uniref:agmatinase n=1 Tax=unclassified Burkholderia TaxID=2613784 RepID=UPI000F577EF5|nr:MULTISPECIES: agmatinase [unclassified Burkholderia]RQR68753.1 agmatinase [Burkholderia sp. Bp9012]RQR70072.1 agmatinase [Burkholderia sp. Bp9011]RQR82986.1 agmatinase [Burkholderia sp. Bp9010]RQZ39416.1 agmatinase [Burkholderia sp. Bp9099]